MAASYSLNRLANSADSSFLQKKLERFSDSYHVSDNILNFLHLIHNFSQNGFK